jgi:hypothetical protein
MENLHRSGRPQDLPEINRLCYFDKTRTTLKTTRPTMILLLRVHSLPGARVYRAVAWQR